MAPPSASPAPTKWSDPSSRATGPAGREEGAQAARPADAAGGAGGGGSHSAWTAPTCASAL
eukprot:12746049-Alexandrium_andersonii.AAC.2